MTSRITALLPLITAAWKRSGVVVRGGASASDIKRFERLHGVRLAAEVVEYFREIGGMDEDDADEHRIRFWPLSEVRPVVEETPNVSSEAFEGYFVFADYSLWAHGYALGLMESQGDVIVVGGETPIALAPDFAAFLELYVRNPERLFPKQ